MKDAPMRYLSYVYEGAARWGRAEGEAVVDLTDHAPNLKSALAAGLPTAGRPRASSAS